MTLLAPNDWACASARRTFSLTLAGRNLATWTNYTGFDPELNWNGSSNFSTAEFLTQPPVRDSTARVVTELGKQRWANDGLSTLHSDRIRQLSSAIEYRLDETEQVDTTTAERTSWLFRNNLSIN